MRPLLRRLWQRMVLATMIALTKYVLRMPRSKAIRVGGKMGYVAYHLAYYVARRKRLIALQNLRLVYGGAKTDKEREVIVRGVFMHFGRMLIDFLYASTLSNTEMAKLVTHVDGWDEYVVPLNDAKQPAVLVTAHLGNFELLARWMAHNGVKLSVVARQPDDPAFAAYIRKMRENAGFIIFNKGESARSLLNTLKDGKWLGILPDQNSGDIFVPFFGVPVGTAIGTAAFALKTGAPILPVFCLREPDDSYRMIIMPPIYAIDTGDREADYRRIMTQVNEVLETIILRYPDQWLWLHNRWKSAFEPHNRSTWSSPEAFQAAVRRRAGSTE